jgi:hypothetical protein
MTTDHGTHQAALTEDLDRHPDTDETVEPTSGNGADRGTETGTTDFGADSATSSQTSSSEMSASEMSSSESSSSESSSSESLIDPDRATAFQARWNELKGEFVDDPRHTVRRIDGLVGEVLDEVEQVFRKQRGELESGMADEGASTEDLRVAFGRYREFFDRLLTF